MLKHLNGDDLPVIHKGDSMVDIEPFRFQFCTAFKERKQLADKLNEVIDALNNGGGDVPTDIQEQIDEIKQRLDDDESDITDLSTAIDGIDSNLTTMQEQIDTVDNRTSDYSIYKGQFNNLNGIVYGFINNPPNPDNRRPVLRVTGYGTDPYLRVNKDVAFLDDIPQFTKIDDKPSSNNAFISEYMYEDANGFYRWKQDIMIVCSMTSGEFKAVAFKGFKDEPTNFGTYLYQEAGFNSNNQYVITHWLLPSSPYNSVIYKTTLTFSSSGVTRTSDLTVPFTWELYIR